MDKFERDDKNKDGHVLKRYILETSEWPADVSDSAKGQPKLRVFQVEPDLALVLRWALLMHCSVKVMIINNEIGFYRKYGRIGDLLGISGATRIGIWPWPESRENYNCDASDDNNSTHSDCYNQFDPNFGLYEIGWPRDKFTQQIFLFRMEVSEYNILFNIS